MKLYLGKCPNCTEWITDEAFKNQKKRAKKSLFKKVPLYCPRCGDEFGFSGLTLLLCFLSFAGCILFLFTEGLISYIPFLFLSLFYLNCRFGNGLVSKSTHNNVA